MSTNNIKLRRLGTLIGILLLSIAASPTLADNDTDRLRSVVEHGGIMEHLEALQKIADENGGNRAIKPFDYVGPNGDQKTRSYIKRILKRAGFNPREEFFTFNNFHETTPAILELISPLPSKAYKNGVPGDETAQFAIVQDSGNGDITLPIQAVHIIIPLASDPASKSKSGCETTDFENPLFEPGKIALIQRVFCTYRVKVENAIAAGAAGVIIFNEGNTPERINLQGGTLQLGAPVSIPVVITDFRVGNELYQKLAGTDPVNVHVSTNAEYLKTTTANIFAETEGRPDHVVMVGAHLDSVEEGPGINDNGSGIATLLEIAKGMQRLHIHPRNQICFAFWGAEEAGQAGSNQYVNNLSDADAAKIALYLNADMLGSPNFVPSVYEPDFSINIGTRNPPFTMPQPADGSIEIRRVLVDYFESVGPSPKLLAIDRRSDYDAFLFAGIPFAAITSGFDGSGNKTAEEAANFGGTAGQPYDA